MRLGDLLEQAVAVGGRLDVARRLDHPLAQVGDDVRLLEHDVGRAGPERLDRGLVRLARGHDDHRGQRRLVAGELQELDPAARRGRVGVDQRDGVELVQQLVARAHRIVGPGHDQPDLGQQPVEPLDDLLVGVDDQDLLPGGGGLIGHVVLNLTWNPRSGSRPRRAGTLDAAWGSRGPPTWIPSSTERCSRRAASAPRTFTSNRGWRRFLRIAGELRTLSDGPHPLPPLSREFLHSLGMSLLNDRRRETLERTGDVIVAMATSNGGRQRAHLFHHRGGLSLSLRLIPPEVPALRQAGAARRDARADRPARSARAWR